MTLAHGKLYEDKAALLNITKSTAKSQSALFSVKCRGDRSNLDSKTLNVVVLTCRTKKQTT